MEKTCTKVHACSNFSKNFRQTLNKKPSLPQASKIQAYCSLIAQPTLDGSNNGGPLNGYRHSGMLN